MENPNQAKADRPPLNPSDGSLSLDPDLDEPPSSFKPPIKGKVSRRRLVTRWLKRSLLILVALAAVALIVVAALPKPVPVDIAEVDRGPMEVTVDEDGHARVKDRYVVSAPLSGSLARIELTPGDSVKQGDVLARLVPLTPALMDERSRTGAEARVAASVAAQRQARSQIERAKATLDFATAEAQRLQSLAKDGVLPRHELETALLNERTAKAELESLRFGARVADYEIEMARAALGHLSSKGKDRQEQLEVPSPVAGRILKVMQQSEGVVQAGAPLLEVGDPKALEIVVDVLTSDAVLIQPGATVSVDRWGGVALDARVRMIEPSAFTRLSALGVEEQRVNVVIDLVAPQEQWETLGDGYRVEAHIVTWQADEVTQVPASAVFRHQGGWAVYQVAGEVAKLTPVQIGQRNGREVAITEGLQPAARVIIHPSDRITDGVAVVQR